MAKKQKNPLAALKKIRAEAPESPIEEIVTAGAGFPDPGAYRTGPWSLQSAEVVEFSGRPGLVRCVFEAEGGPGPFRVDLPLTVGEDPKLYRRGWGRVRGFLAHAEIDEGVQEAGLEAAARPDRKGAIAEVVEALAAIQEAVIDVRFNRRGWPAYGPLPLDTDEDAYTPRGMTPEEAERARAEDEAKRKGAAGGREYDDEDEDEDEDEVV